MIRKRNLSSELQAWIMGMGLGALGLGLGKVFFLVPALSATAQFKSWLWKNGVDDENYSSDFITLYDRMVTGRNDCMVVLPGSHAFTAAKALSKSYTHIIGASAPNPVNPRCRFSLAVAGTPMATFSGSGCLIKNVMFSQDVSHASTNAVTGYVTGARNAFEQVTFRSIGALNVAGNAYRALKLAASDGENLFQDCTIGADTVDAGTATNYVIELAASGNQRTLFRDCRVLGNGSANQCFLLATAAGAIDGSWIQFSNTLFSNPKQGAYDEMTQGFNLAAAANGLIYLDAGCLIDGCATLETTNSGLIIGPNAFAAGTSCTGVALTF